MEKRWSIRCRAPTRWTSESMPGWVSLMNEATLTVLIGMIRERRIYAMVGKAVGRQGLVGIQRRQPSDRERRASRRSKLGRRVRESREWETWHALVAGWLKSNGSKTCLQFFLTFARILVQLKAQSTAAQTLQHNREKKKGRMHVLKNDRIAHATIRADIFYPDLVCSGIPRLQQKYKTLRERLFSFLEMFKGRHSFCMDFWSNLRMARCSRCPLSEGFSIPRIVKKSKPKLPMEWMELTRQKNQVHA